MSNDIDIFHDREQSLAGTAEADVAALSKAGLEVQWIEPRTSAKMSAQIIRGEETTKLDWVADSDFRYFPAVPDNEFGFVLHPIDLATNKAAAAADRREPRDIVDLVTIHETILPLGAVITAALGRFPGPSPEGMLGEIRWHSRLTAPELQALATTQPLDAAGLRVRIQKMLEDAERFVGDIPSDAVGCLFLDNGKPVQPDLTALERYFRHHATRRGRWPGSPEVDSEMIRRHVGDKE
ncbi:hypothetical protein GIW81_14720 [Hyphomicrobium sp. xq]|uniref:Nucleotidyl transferase AbiEii toxin, Type IV TA system n=2 Tax=Hyphomicrobium album TaxID=2665159 RepID=A0A6I3KNU1_9HYPH|nr:hypothetical protein [Hyphomicrobium album]